MIAVAAFPVTGSADEVAVSGTSATFATINAMVANQVFMFVSSTDCWIKQSAAGTAATAGAGSMFVPAKTLIMIDGALGAKLSVIQDSGAGKATLVPVKL